MFNACGGDCYNWSNGETIRRLHEDTKQRTGGIRNTWSSGETTDSRSIVREREISK